MKILVPASAAFAPLDGQARYKGAWGGRGSGKSHYFAESLVVRALQMPGHKGVCIREVQSTLKDSCKALIEAKLAEMGLGERQGFKTLSSEIRTPGNGLIIFRGMQDYNADSIKSLEGFHTAWVDEAQNLSATSLMMLRPTIRAADSELWFSWNPRRKQDAVDLMFRGPMPPQDARCVQVNWTENAFITEALEKERTEFLRSNPDQYDHVWGGKYAGITTGSYFATQLHETTHAGRIGHVGPDPYQPYRVFVDIGGTGARSDAFVMWVAQVIGREVRVLAHYEKQGQPFATHLSWLREQKYLPADTIVYLPHDGVQQDKVFSVSYESAFAGAGYQVEIVPNQGTGAAMLRVQAARRLFPSVWFNEPGCAAGIETLGYYHAKIDPTRQIDLGPEHDWASHSADAFGMLCIVCEKLFSQETWSSTLDYSKVDRGTGVY